MPSTRPVWTHEIIVHWKVVAEDTDAAWDIADAILEEALRDSPDVVAVHDSTDVNRIKSNG